MDTNNLSKEIRNYFLGELNKLKLNKINEIKIKKKDIVDASLYDDLINEKIYILYSGQK